MQNLVLKWDFAIFVPEEHSPNINDTKLLVFNSKIKTSGATDALNSELYLQDTFKVCVGYGHVNKHPFSLLMV